MNTTQKAQTRIAAALLSTVILASLSACASGNTVEPALNQGGKSGGVIVQEHIAKEMLRLQHPVPGHILIENDIAQELARLEHPLPGYILIQDDIAKELERLQSDHAATPRPGLL